MLKIKNLIHLNWRQTLALVALVGLVVISRLGHAPAQAVIQGYNTDDTLQAGMIVTLSQTDSTKVQTATNETAEQMRGVVVDPNDATVTLSAPNQKVFVASTGRFAVLVSNQNGAVHANDYISLSSLPGIGMRARTDQQVVLGRAVTTFDGSSGVVTTTTVKEGNNSKQVVLGKIAVDISIIRNPASGTGGAHLPGFLQNASSSIAGKNVSPGKIYLAAALLLMSGIIAGSMLYAGVRSSIVAIGRNPLSRGSIVRSLVQVVVTSLIIFIGGLFGVYLLLKI